MSKLPGSETTPRAQVRAVPFATQLLITDSAVTIRTGRSWRDDRNHRTAQLRYGRELVRRPARPGPTGAWSSPGLGVWDVRALAGHTPRALITVGTYQDRPAAEAAVATPWDYYALLASAASSPEAVAERGRRAGEALGDDPAGFIRALIERLQNKLPQNDPIIERSPAGWRSTAIYRRVPSSWWCTATTWPLLSTSSPLGFAPPYRPASPSSGPQAVV